MLRLTHPLYFPQISRIGETHFKSWSENDSEKTVNIYKLDWSQIDKFKKENFYKHIANSSDEKYFGSIPEPYDSWVQDLQFVVPRDYLEEIRKCSKKAAMRWGNEYPFDTMIREICLEPAISFVNVAFRLLSDCLYDSETNYFSRDSSRKIVTQALLYKFWRDQTGRGLVRDHAYFDKLNKMMKYVLEDKNQDKERNKLVSIIRDFLKVIDKFEEETNEYYERRNTIQECGSNVGPSLGD